MIEWSSELEVGGERVGGGVPQDDVRTAGHAALQPVLVYEIPGKRTMLGMLVPKRCLA